MNFILIWIQNNIFRLRMFSSFFHPDRISSIAFSVPLVFVGHYEFHFDIDPFDKLLRSREIFSGFYMCCHNTFSQTGFLQLGAHQNLTISF